MYHRFNFFKNTFAIFKKASKPSNFIKPHYISKHGSWYYFTDQGVYRYSNHWGRVGNCRWRLEGIDFKQQVNYWGYCHWSDFYINNDGDKLYFIEKVGKTTYTYNHINNATSKDIVLRSAADTAKVLKKINEIIQTNNWAKHLNYSNYTDLQDYFIKKMIETNQSLLKIKREYIQSNINL